MSELSVFIDESGDFGPYQSHAPLYVITFVFHDQSHDIDGQVARLRRRVVEAGFPERHAIHSAPLIRREGDYASLDMTERRRLFRALFTFMRSCDIKYKAFVFNKREFTGHDQMVARMSREVGGFVRGNLALFQSYDRVIVYYDNGQKEITNLVNTVFNVFLEAEVRKVKPSDYCLFQAADMFCTLRLLSEKLDGRGLELSKSERRFFLSPRKLKKDYLKPARQERLQL